MAGQPRPTGRRIVMGKELRRLRKGVGLTLADAADGLGFSEAQLQRVETGLSSLRRSQHLRALLDRYGVTDEDAVDEAPRTPAGRRPGRVGGRVQGLDDTAADAEVRRHRGAGP